MWLASRKYFLGTFASWGVLLGGLTKYAVSRLEGLLLGVFNKYSMPRVGLRAPSLPTLKNRCSCLSGDPTPPASTSSGRSRPLGVLLGGLKTHE